MGNNSPFGIKITDQGICAKQHQAVYSAAFLYCFWQPCVRPRMYEFSKKGPASVRNIFNTQCNQQQYENNNQCLSEKDRQRSQGNKQTCPVYVNVPKKKSRGVQKGLSSCSQRMAMAVQ
jgi:hypothetical protein